MPTPSSNDPLPPPPAPASLLSRNLHATCPPEDDRHPPARGEDVASHEDVEHVVEQQPRSATVPTPFSHAAVSLLDPRSQFPSPSPQMDPSDTMRDSPSPVHGTLGQRSHVAEQRQMQSDIPSPRRVETPDIHSARSQALPKYTSSYLRTGSVFKGTQQSDRQVYNVNVEIKHVDMSESSICGYLTIQGLTQDHPTLTTYFEGEVIGTKYSFQTRRPEWGSNEKIDMQHWNRFPAWKPLARAARRPDFSYKNFAERESIFMRWKEYFLVPDHRVRTINGASFEGFYYICFNQVQGTVSGIYFHSKSEKFQQLELKHVDDRGCMPAIELR